MYTYILLMETFKKMWIWCDLQTVGCMYIFVRVSSQKSASDYVILDFAVSSSGIFVHRIPKSCKKKKSFKDVIFDFSLGIKLCSFLVKF